MVSVGLLALLSGIVAQALKVLFEGLRGRWQPGLFFSSGGMPSSHTSTVTTLALLVGLRDGVMSPIFSVVVVFGFYVIFEATGLRQEVGKQARLLNDIVDDLRVSRQQAFDRDRLREIVGHTWAEVAGGFVCGVVVVLLLRLLDPTFIAE